LFFLSFYILPYPIEILHVLPWNIADFIDEVFVLFCLIFLMFISVKRNYIILPFLKYVVLFIYISILSLLVNSSPLISGVHFLFSFLKPIIFFYFILNVKLPEKFYFKVFYLIIFISIVQILINIGWFLGVNPLPNPLSYPDPDFAVGTFGHKSSREVANFLCLIFIFLMTYIKFYTKSKYNIILGSLLLFTLSLSSSKITFVVLFITIIIILPLLLDVRIFRYIIISALLLLVGIISLKKVEPLIFDRFMTYISIGIRENPKIIAYKDLMFELKNDVPFYLLGAGPGMYASTMAISKKTPLALKYVINPNFYDQHISISGLKISSTGIGFIRATGYTGIAGDIGFFGLFAYLLIYFKAFNFVFTLGKKTKNKIWKTVCLSTAGCLVYILIYNSLYDLFSVSLITLPLWIFIGFIFKYKRDITKYIC